MNAFNYTLISNIIISLCSLFGLVSLYKIKEKSQRLLLYVVAFSAGTMLSTSFLHLIVEAASVISIYTVNLLVVISFTLFYVFERLLHWHHHHDVRDEKHTVGIMNLTADTIHNFCDGLIIAGSFLTSTEMGVLATIVVILHEIPQEIGDFGVLLHSGFSRKSAALANLAVSLTAVVGGIVGNIASNYISVLPPYIMAFAAGGFIYIAASDLIPTLNKESKELNTKLAFLLFCAGILIISVFKD
jgi:zinc and cadmium transporter